MPGFIEPKFTPEQQAERQLVEDATRAASDAGFAPGSHRHTEHVLKFIRGEWDGPVTHRPVILVVR